MLNKKTVFLYFSVYALTAAIYVVLYGKQSNATLYELILIATAIGAMFSLFGISLPTGQYIAQDEQIQKITKWIALVGGILFLTLTLLANISMAFSTSISLNWDETYYANIAATDVAGLGLQPYMQGYGEIPIMGGVGYFARLYSFVYKYIGPSIYNLRVIPTIAILLALVGVYHTTKLLYGPITGLVAVVILPSLHLFELYTNSIRMDAIMWAYLIWAIYFFVRTLSAPKLHKTLWVGIIFGMALQAHLHTFAIAFAIGFYYLVQAAMSMYQQRQWYTSATSHLLIFVNGYVIAFVFFIIFNVLPDPEAFFKVTGAARLSAPMGAGQSINLSNEMNQLDLVRRFIDPRILIAKELERYRQMYQILDAGELLLWVAAMTSLISRRHKTDALLGILILGTLIGGGIILNSTAGQYTLHISPILYLAIPPLLTHGFRRDNHSESHSPNYVLMLLAIPLFWSVLSPITQIKTIQDSLHRGLLHSAPHNPVVESVLNSTNTACHITSDRALYIPYFMTYPKFTPMSVTIFIGRTFWDMNDQPLTTYWAHRSPDVFIGPLGFGAEEYVLEAEYIEILPESLWIKPDNYTTGCEMNFQSVN